MLGSELRNVATSPGPIGSRIKIKQIVNRSTSIKTPLLPSVNIKKKDFAEDQDDATTQSKSYQFGSKKRERKRDDEKLIHCDSEVRFLGVV